MRKSDPGYPLRNFAKTNDRALELYPQLVDVAIERIMLLFDADAMSISALAAFRRGLVDPIRVFPKNEPHTEKKLREGRVRLICSVSLVDNIIDRCIFGLQNSNEIENWKTIPSKPGMGFSEDSVLALSAEVESYSFPVSTDASGWDWSVQGWEYEMEAQARVKLMKGCTPLLSRLIHNRMRCMASSVFILPSGAIYAQDTPGIMKSGLYVTSSSNSRIGFMDYKMIGGTRIIVQGDDTVQEKVDDYEDKYLTLGHRVTGVEEESGFEFCSQRFSARTRYSQNAHKLVFNLIHQNKVPLSERMARFAVFLEDLGEHPEKEYHISCLRDAHYFANDPQDLQAGSWM